MGKIARPLIRRMRIANGVLAPLWTLGFVASLINDGDQYVETGNWAGLFNRFIGMVLLSVPFYLAWRSLGSGSTIFRVRRTLLVFVALAGLTCLLPIILIIAFSDKSMILPALLPFLLVMLLYVLNIKALIHRKAELEETKADQAAEPI
jgi:thiol:disulfide interchange protein